MHSTKVTYPEPMQLTGILDQYESFQVTPCIGTEFPKANLAEWLSSPNADALLRDLAITIAQRGVVFFRAQTGLDGELQKELTHRLGVQSGKPAGHRLSKHPLHLIRKDDPEMGILDPGRQQKLHAVENSQKRQRAVLEYHSDGSYEVCPPDFTMLRMTEIPPTGGDTLWASGYELYDRLSTPYQKFFESLTAQHEVPSLRKLAETEPGIYDGPRGAPANTDMQFKQSHPMVRTHPVTGWKTLFAGGLHCRRINDVTDFESEQLLSKIISLVGDNHDLQVRFRWNNPGDVAIWDNRCVLHCPTQDHYGLGGRMGYRTMGIAEQPYFDPNSVSRQEALAAAAK
ncbi:putative alpha-ketoglutarate-dependent sulfonate dioxygenase [Aspergillus nomiae NRRL 13137]|uniref:Putative alpha-ketoglutarate-dependent sulfonate dioxygenase n=1 Tax=Aspergillus nomiae NRRL (strain ATCC 15546 / NRRL 13137 / CBS 260.88 / M93) TaxID=1509407 RepID=A0A0L1JI52_ASPN3|nr:putative alpha-ketoglutarate-dependent sulfonate dioxygenase [Aspergillus nomiae NRRL 13137]KNG91429.1 putative alpha-ketoglutarate-dependent sulfonate dioxygenase [Aspergillus nomiae NRRL 13137]